MVWLWVLLEEMLDSFGAWNDVDVDVDVDVDEGEGDDDAKIRL